MDASSLSLLDIVVFIILGISILSGMWRGFISSVLSLAGWFFAIYLTHELYPTVAGIFIGSARETSSIMLIGHLILFVVLLIAFSLFNKMILAATGILRAGFI